MVAITADRRKGLIRAHTWGIDSMEGHGDDVARARDEEFDSWRSFENV